MRTLAINKDGQEIVKASYLAKHYKVTEPTIYSWAKKGKLPCIKFENTIRFNFEAVKAAIEGVPASPPREEPPEIEEQIEALRSRNFEEQAALAEEEEVVR
jgi:excisionase family DNA binding protein